MVWRKPAHTSPGAGAGCGPSQTLFHMRGAKHTGPLFCGLPWVCSCHPPLLGRMPPAVQKGSMAERPQATDSCSGRDQELCVRKRGGLPGWPSG